MSKYCYSNEGAIYAKGLLNRPNKFLSVAALLLTS